VCDLVGNNFDKHAVLKPASERPNAAYQKLFNSEQNLLSTQLHLLPQQLRRKYGRSLYNCRFYLSPETLLYQIVSLLALTQLMVYDLKLLRRII